MSSEGASVGMEAKIEAMLIRLRKCGTPRTQRDYRVVLAMLLPCNDEALQEIARLSRALGVGYMQRLAECLLVELGSGRAERDAGGAIRMKKRPESDELRRIYEG